MSNTEKMSRRDFLKLSGLVIASPQLGKVEKILDYKNLEVNNRLFVAKTIVSKQAAIQAKEFFGEKPYRFGKTDCANYAGQIVSYYGILTERNIISTNSYKPDIRKPLPNATTVKQAAWFKAIDRSLGGGFVTETETANLENDDFWLDVNPGALVYLKTKGEGHHGYNQYSHVGAFLGFDENRKPTFGEYAFGMKKGPEIKRSLRQFLGMYCGEVPEGIDATIIDIFKLAPEIWKQKYGVVRPNSEDLIKAGYEGFLTVNINNGLTSYWETGINKTPIRRGFSNGARQLFSVIGRNLIPRSELTKKYDDFVLKASKYERYSHLRLTSYDGINAVMRGVPVSVPRYCLTPPLVFGLSYFRRVSNFGQLGGVTDIAIMHALWKNEYGKIEEIEENSNYTIHATPQDTDSEQDLLLRDIFLDKANKEGEPLSPGEVHLTSGCVNFTPSSFEVIKETIGENDKKTVVIFSYPQFPQDVQLRNEGFLYKNDPLSNNIASQWEYHL